MKVRSFPLLFIWSIVLWTTPLVTAADFIVGVAQSDAGGSLLLPVTLTGASAPVAVQFDVVYEKDTLVSSPVLRGPATVNHQVKDHLRSEGRRRVLIYSTPVQEIPDGVIIEIPFSISPAAQGKEAVGLDDLIIALADGQSLVPSSVASGEVTLGEDPPPPGETVSISGISVSSDGRFSFAVQGPEGTNYEVQMSSNLQDWSSLTTIQVENGSASFDAAVNPGKQFYRVLRP